MKVMKGLKNGGFGSIAARGISDNSDETMKEERTYERP